MNASIAKLIWIFIFRSKTITDISSMFSYWVVKNILYFFSNEFTYLLKFLQNELTRNLSKSWVYVLYSLILSFMIMHQIVKHVILSRFLSPYFTAKDPLIGFKSYRYLIILFIGVQYTVRHENYVCSELKEKRLPLSWNFFFQSYFPIVILIHTTNISRLFQWRLLKLLYCFNE